MLTSHSSHSTVACSMIVHLALFAQDAFTSGTMFAPHMPQCKCVSKTAQDDVAPRTFLVRDHNDPQDDVAHLVGYAGALERTVFLGVYTARQRD